MKVSRPLRQLNERIVACERCPRLRAHCRQAAERKPKRYRDWTYWARPVPNLIAPGPHGPRLLVVGLAPAAHGANRTGRMFTGDRSGDFLFGAMYQTGFCNNCEARAVDDGLELRDAAITAVAHCAPPDNKPTPAELAHCREYLEGTFDALDRLRVVVCLGQIAHQAVLRLYKDRGWVAAMVAHPFAHGAVHRFDEAEPGVHTGNAARSRGVPPVIDSYHPSQQNTFTGRLTAAMLRRVFEQARGLVEAG